VRVTVPSRRDDLRVAAAPPGRGPVSVSRPRPQRARAAAALAGHVAATMPWVPLLAGCCAGTGLTAALALLAGSLQQPLALGIFIRAAFVPVLAAAAFLPADPVRQLTGALPARAWLTPAMRLALALPVLAGTCWAELRLAGLAFAADLRVAGVHPQPLPAAGLAAELAGCCAIALAVAALVARGRWHDLGGALAAPAAVAVLAALALLPVHLLPAGMVGLTRHQQHAWAGAARGWLAVTVIAFAVACWAARDPWRRWRLFPS
jgi:hypothetical protein